MAAKHQASVLTQSDYDQMMLALKNLDDVPGVIAKAETCGVNCEEYRKMLDYTKNALDQMIKTWFPKGRPK